MEKMMCKLRAINWQRALCIAFAVYAMTLTVLTTIQGSVYQGEAASYTLTTVSLVHDRNAIVSEQELAIAQNWFPEWAKVYESFKGSGYTTPQGTVPWYFPTYPAACIPVLVLLRVFSQPLSYAFCLTNLLLFLLLLLFVVTDKKLKLSQRWLLFFLLALHPALFYLPWPSAEVLQFVGVALAALCWATGRKHRAALCIALVGTTNPCALAMGLVMIAEYLVTLFLQGTKGCRWRTLLGNWKQILLYGCCYVPGIVPFFYNYSICGSINLTASHGNEWVPLNDFTVFRQLWAYFTDWSFGLLPYMPLLLIVGVLLLIPAVLRRNSRYLLMWAAMVAVMLGCSLMANVDCGMSGIARYNAWTSPVLAVAVCTQLEALLKGISAKCAAVILVCSALYSGTLVTIYNAEYITPASWETATPIALKVVDLAPALYSPLDSTFIWRANGNATIPFCYYQNDKNYIRKLYVSSADAEALRDYIGSTDAEALRRFEAQVDALGQTPQYINVARADKLFVKHWTVSFQNGMLFAANGQLHDDVLITDGSAGYAMLGPDETLAAGSYRAHLKAVCQTMPADAPAQLQIGTKDAEENYIMLTSTPLAADGTATIDFTLETKTENMTYRVYQNEGTALEITGVEIERLS